MCIERIGRVTIYKRGSAYYVYYREFGRTVRRRVDGNLATARIGASKVNAAIGEGSPSLFSLEYSASNTAASAAQGGGEGMIPSA